MRRPPFLVALALLSLAFLAEVVGGSVLPGGELDPGVVDRYLREETSFTARERVEAIAELRAGEEDRPPGFGIRSLALVDAPLLLSMGLLAIAMVVPHRLHGRVVGVVNLIGGVVLIILGAILLVVAVSSLFLMLGLFLSPPFGTLAYLARYGFFDRPGAAVILGIALAAKLAFLVLALVSYPRFLHEKRLMLMIATSFVTLLLVAFLHGLVPLVLVSIVDAVAAIVVAVVALIWAVALTVSSLPSVARVLRARRT